ncbi:MAG: hypothetical protein J5610_04475 [Prevotella sp.]|nr:hypothetical protein [Prevotella sp.]
MKKIFTLIAVAMMAVGASAQSYMVQKDDAPTAGTKITSVPNITMTYSVAGQAAFKTAKSLGDALKEVSGYLAKTDGNGVNPTDNNVSENYANGMGFDKSGELPTKGTFYVFEPTVDDMLEVFMICNADKTFVIAEDGVNIATRLDALNVKAYGEDGVAIEGLTFETVTLNNVVVGGKFNNKVYGTVTFPVKAGKTYYVFVCGSKLGFGGFTFPAPTSGISPVVAAFLDNANAPIYNLAGQQVTKAYKGVVIQNGVKRIQK